MNSQIKVLIVDDSAFMRKLISDFLQEDSRFQVIGTAKNGKEAIQKVKDLRPDVVTLDIEMPEVNGLEALKIIMRQSPTRVVMLSSTTQEGAENALLAIAYGAVDFIAKPSGPISLDLEKIKDKIIEKVFLASKANINVLTKSFEKPQPKRSYRHVATSFKTKVGMSKLVCIGTSTGGPRALQQVLTKLPATIDAPILIVQHMPAGFTKSLANRLNSLCEISVKEAEDGEFIKKGVAYIAPGGYHFQIKRSGNNLAVCLKQSQPVNGHRPSVDMLFQSISECSNYRKIAVIMTGMGTDGTNGLKALKSKGSTIAIAESKESSIVFGMPKSAITANLVDEIVHLENIASTIMKYINA